MTTKKLETQRLIFNPFDPKHLTTRYVSWLNDPRVVRFSELRHSQHTLESCRTYHASFARSPHHFWAISLKNGLHIGNITAHVDVNNCLADIGILIGDVTQWGKGYGYESWQRICDFLLKELSLRKVTGGTLSINAPMIQIMKRSGMIEDGRRNSHYIVDGDIVDMNYYCLFNE